MKIFALITCWAILQFMPLMYFQHISPIHTFAKLNSHIEHAVTQFNQQSNLTINTLSSNMERF